jgi:hypothetical protein
MATVKNKKTGETPCFAVVPWDDFLYMLKEGENL